MLTDFTAGCPTRIVSEPRCLKFELDDWVGRESPEKDFGSDVAECLSVETVEACSSVGQGGDVELELTLGLGTVGC